MDNDISNALKDVSSLISHFDSVAVPKPNTSFEAALTKTLAQQRIQLISYHLHISSLSVVVESLMELLNDDQKKTLVSNLVKLKNDISAEIESSKIVSPKTSPIIQVTK